MPRWSAIFIATSFVYLVLGSAWGAWLLATKGTAHMAGLPWSLRAWHVYAMLMGWLTQFIWGIGFWAFPRFRTSRGSVYLLPWVWGLLNLGLLLSLVGTAVRSLSLRFPGLVLVALAAAVFAWHAWPRIKPPGA